jgi:hypothetical protein
MLSRLYTVLLILVVAWSSCAMFGLIGVSVSALIFLLLFIVSGRWRASLWIGLLCVAVLFSLLLPASPNVREVARRIACTNQLKQIGLALHNYHQKYGSFPPASVAGKDGTPMHSWRVLILPFMECESLYREYDFNEPWNSPSNRKVLAKCPKTYICPSVGSVNSESTACANYIAVVGPKAAWAGQKSRTRNDLTSHGDGSDTIMVIETADTSINWSEPWDLDIDAPTMADSSAMQPRPSSAHMQDNGLFYRDTMQAINALMVDGSVRSLPAKYFTGSMPKAMLQMNGCDVDSLDWAVDRRQLQVNWPNVAVLVVWLVSVSLLFHQSIRSRKNTADQQPHSKLGAVNS